MAGQAVIKKIHKITEKQELFLLHLATVCAIITVKYYAVLMYLLTVSAIETIERIT